MNTSSTRRVLASFGQKTCAFALTSALAVIANFPAQAQNAQQPTANSADPGVKIPPIVVKAPSESKKAKTAKKNTGTSQAPAPAAAQASPAPAIQLKQAPSGLSNPTGQTVTNLNGAAAAAGSEPVFSVGDLVKDSPGVSVKQGNGPRDIGLSIRGSNARNGFGVRNIQVFEDGFPVTQPDGLSRTDLTDPHAYAGVDVYRGPSSVLFGNYATGGAINFRTRTGGEINGGAYGVEAGSNGYLNNYLIAGGKSGAFEASVFASDVRGDGFLGYSAFNTQTINALISVDVTPNDKITVKVIDNQLFTQLPVRLSLNQYKTNPYQVGCEHAATAAAGCGTVNLLVNGFATQINGQTVAPTVAQTAAEAGLHRDDRRTILGTRWEHDFGNNTVWRTQFVFDDRDINQPTGATSAVGDFPSYNVSSDLINRSGIFGFNATHLVGVFYNTLTSSSDTFNLKPGGDATLGRRSANVSSTTSNGGIRAREEIDLNRYWTVVAGADLETTSLTGVSSAFSFSGQNGEITTVNKVAADKEFLNSAKEGALIYRPAEEWQLRARVATAYGTPQIGNLFVTQAGIPGDNTQLKPQTNTGYDLGVDWRPTKATKLSVTGFYEFFENELVSQSAGANLQSFTFNAPASEHRGIEVAAEVGLTPEWRLTGVYSLNDQYYTDYVERLSAGKLSTAFDRAGNKIPGVSPNELTAQLRYDEVDGPWKGFGGFLEYQWKDAFFMDNANLLKAPGYDLVNFNLHYNVKVESNWVSRLGVFFEVRNIFDKTYIASANNITNTISSSTGAQNLTNVLANSTGSIYAGAPRTFVTGMKMEF